MFYASRFRECIEKGREAIRLLEQTGDYWEVHIARYQVAAALYHLGEVDESVLECRKNYESGMLLGDEPAAGIIFDVWVRALRGEVDGSLLQEQVAVKRQDVQGIAQLAFADGIYSLQQDKFDLAIERLKHAAEVSARAGIHNAYTLPAGTWLATAYRKRAMHSSPYQPAERANYLSLAKKAANRAVRSGRICANDLPRAIRELGIIAAAEGHCRKAERYFNQSLSVAQRIESRYEYAQTLLYRGRVGLANQWSHAESNLAQAEQIFHSIETAGGKNLYRRSDDMVATLSLADRFDTVLQAGRQIASALTSDRIFQESLQAARKLLRCENCRLIELSPDGQLHFINGEQITLDGECAENMMHALSIGRAKGCTENSPQGSRANSSAHQRSAIYIPIKVRDRYIACLTATQESLRDYFRQNEERLADFVAAITGAALENAEGFQNLEYLNVNLEQLVSDRTAAMQTKALELAESYTQLKATADELLIAKDELRIAKEQAEAANEAKSRFLATISHEIRTPMNGILGMTDLAMRTELTPKQRNCLSIVGQSSQALLNLLNDVLDLSKIEAGKVDLEEIEFSLSDIVGAVTKLMAVSAAEKHVEVMHQISSDVPSHLLGDSCRLRQVIVNLVGNAIKFTDQGHVLVACSTELDENRSRNVARFGQRYWTRYSKIKTSHHL